MNQSQIAQDQVVQNFQEPIAPDATTNATKKVASQSEKTAEPEQPFETYFNHTFKPAYVTTASVDDCAVDKSNSANYRLPCLGSFSSSCGNSSDKALVFGPFCEKHNLKMLDRNFHGWYTPNLITNTGCLGVNSSSNTLATNKIMLPLSTFLSRCSESEINNWFKENPRLSPIEKQRWIEFYRFGGRGLTDNYQTIVNTDYEGFMSEYKSYLIKALVPYQDLMNKTIIPITFDAAFIDSPNLKANIYVNTKVELLKTEKRMMKQKVDGTEIDAYIAYFKINELNMLDQALILSYNFEVLPDGLILQSNIGLHNNLVIHGHGRAIYNTPKMHIVSNFAAYQSSIQSFLKKEWEQKEIIRNVDPLYLPALPCNSSADAASLVVQHQPMINFYVTMNSEAKFNLPGQNAIVLRYV